MSGGMRRLVLEVRDGAPDGLGGRTGGWTPKGEHWGRLEPRSAGLDAGDGGPRSRARYRVVIRAVPVGAPSRPKPGDRFLDGARVLPIRGVLDADPMARHLICFVDEEVRP